MSPEAAPFRVAIDTGGTFTDVAVSRADGGLFVWKVSSIPEAPDQAVVNGLTEALEILRVSPSQVGRFVHGTTVATNALLTTTGSRVGLVTTKGFADVLRIGHQTRPSIYDLSARRPTPLVRRPDIWELDERVGADGRILRQLDRDEMAEVAERIHAAGCDVVVVSFLNAYANHEHEERCVQVLREAGAAPHVFAATSITAELREFERTSTAVINGYVQPVIASYVERLEKALCELRLTSRLWIMQSNGGLLSARNAREQSVRTVLSGLAGGVIAAAQWARKLNLPNVVSFDIGGTSTDIALIRDFEPESMTSGVIDGHHLRLPAVDVHTIGAGGGSIAWRDSGGGLRVGPQSSGASPGPICYARGGSEPTVTDAHLLLGRLGSRLLDGRLTLETEKTRELIDAFAGELGLGLDQAASGIVRVVNATMARGVRKVSVERGVDIRDCVLMAFGGAGPLHAADLIRELGMKAAVVPPHPGIASAVGMLDAPVRHDFAANVADARGNVDIERAQRTIDDLTRQARRFLEADEGVPDDVVELELLIDARYAGQSYELTIPWTADVEALRGAFEAAHQKRYGFADADATLELVTARVTATARLQANSADTMLASGPAPAPAGWRPGFFHDEWQDVPIYRRDQIPARRLLLGPLVIEQLDSTIVVLPGQVCEHDERGFLHIREGESM
jgi:N-methylhydantoinase A